MSEALCSSFVKFVQEIYSTTEYIPLHAPKFEGNEIKYLSDTIDSTYVSSVGKFVDLFEQKVLEYTGSRHAIATVNGTSAIHIALKLVGVEKDSEVITQSLTFVATCNAIRYCGAKPLFVDVDRYGLGLSVESLTEFLEQNSEVRDDGLCWNKTTNRRISACLPVHTFGFPARVDKIKIICDKYKIPLVEDAAESLGSFYHQVHTGTIGKLSALSFNGNKIITTGGGGMILTNDDWLAERARHITTTAKVPHKWGFSHDEIGYNYRLPNINAALGVAQMESLPKQIKNKRKIANQYQKWGEEHGIKFLKEPTNALANYWLNVIIMQDKEQRDLMLEVTNSSKVMTRPVWTPMHKLTINQDCQYSNMVNTDWLADRILNVPSGVNY
jgi:aminotransferase in exopolysaccharide biosynthesis